ncbi:hypothetical protein JRQ81_005430 [Phrynocephalus forsythii]|uniref:Uncharacterized protein n=1 Tax=Phrynocephalus forsythii TaxID=171643 RepID=A0A9Q0XGL9_9SAUR|nr:hypothetical protein JRQ81_005430 [Phrynocephalus forsythii]
MLLYASSLQIHFPALFRAQKRTYSELRIKNCGLFFAASSLVYDCSVTRILSIRNRGLKATVADRMCKTTVPISPAWHQGCPGGKRRKKKSDRRNGEKHCEECETKCPCKEGDTSDHCASCQYCHFCYICPLCETACTPGSIVDELSGALFQTFATLFEQQER